LEVKPRSGSTPGYDVRSVSRTLPPVGQTTNIEVWHLRVKVVGVMHCYGDRRISRRGYPRVGYADRQGAFGNGHETIRSNPDPDP
jgi:hypothetical protein